MNPKYEKIIFSPDSSFKCFYIDREAFPFFWHHHEYFELTLILQGKGRRFIGDSIVEFEKNDLVLIGPDIPHTWSSYKDQTDCQAIVLLFGPDLFVDLIDNKPEFRKIKKLLNESVRGLFFCGDRLPKATEILKNIPKFANLKRLLSLIELLDYISVNLQADFISGKGFKRFSSQKQKIRMEKVLSFIAENYSGSISLDDVANVSHMSPASFSRFFKETTGKTFIQYLNQLRVSRSCELLLETNMSIIQVCYESGFNSLANFNRRFKNIKSISPREYRKMFR